MPPSHQLSRKRDKALLISIQYDSPTQPHVKPLTTPHRDARRLKDFLIEEGYLLENIVHLADNMSNVNSRPTRENVLREIQRFVADVQPSDRRVFFYAGHGYQVRNRRGTELDGMDEAMLLDGHKGPPVDDEDCILDPKALHELPFDHPDKKHLEKLDGIIIDDILRQRLVDKLPPGSSMVAIFDTCHSGTMLDLTFNWKYYGTRYGSMPRHCTVYTSSGSFHFEQKGYQSPVDEHMGNFSSYMPDNGDSGVCMSPSGIESPLAERKYLFFEPASAKANVISISSTEDSQLAWEHGHTMTSVLLEELRRTKQKDDLTLGALMANLRQRTCRLRVELFQEAARRKGKQLEEIKKTCEKVERKQLPQFSSLSRWAPLHAFKL